MHFEDGRSEDDAVRRARETGIDVRPLGYYTHPAAEPACAVAPGLLLGFSAFTPRQIEEGVRDLARALDV